MSQCFWLEKKCWPASYEPIYTYGNHRHWIKAKYFVSGHIHQPLETGQLPNPHRWLYFACCTYFLNQLLISFIIFLLIIVFGMEMTISQAIVYVMTDICTAIPAESAEASVT